MANELTAPPTTDAASPGVAAFVSSKDAQIDALRSVVGANLRVALDSIHDNDLAGLAVAETFGYPITLSLLRSTRMPALAVWRTAKSLAMQGKQKQRNTSFTLRWWMGAIGIDRIGEAWPFLDLAYETIVETIVGNAVLDLTQTDEDGNVARIPSNSLLGQVGFLHVDKRTVRGSFDFARDTGADFVYPVVDVSFTALTEALSGGLNYNADDLDDLCELFATLLNAEIDDEGTISVDETPFVQVLARVDGDRSTQNDADFIIQEDGACVQVVETHATPIED